MPNKQNARALCAAKNAFDAHAFPPPLAKFASAKEMQLQGNDWKLIGCLLEIYVKGHLPSSDPIMLIDAGVDLGFLSGLLV